MAIFLHVHTQKQMTRCYDKEANQSIGCGTVSTNTEDNENAPKQPVIKRNTKKKRTAWGC